MHRIDCPTATPDNKFTEGDPTIPVLATTVTADWLNAVQEELVATILAGGISLDKASNTQLWQALRRLTGNEILTIESEGAEAVKEVALSGYTPATGAKLNIMFTEVNRAVAPQFSVNGDTPKPILFDGVAPEVGDLAKNHVYTVALTGPAWQIMSGMARDRIGQTVWFDDTLSRPGYFPLNGTTVANFAATWPQMAAYLATAHGQERCFESLAEREAAHVAIWHTLASGATVGWEGFGGVCKFYYDPETDTLYMPDLRGMFRAMAGDGIVAPSMGGVLGDRIREIYGRFLTAGLKGPMIHWFANDAFLVDGRPDQQFGFPAGQSTQPGGDDMVYFYASRVVPTGAPNVPQSWGALACAYFGQQATG